MNSLRTIIVRLSRSSSVHLLTKSNPSLSKISNSKRFSSRHSQQSEFVKSGLAYTLIGAGLVGAILAVNISSDTKKKDHKTLVRPVQTIQSNETEVKEEVVVEEETSTSEITPDANSSEQTAIPVEEVAEVAPVAQNESVTEVVIEIISVQSIDSTTNEVITEEPVVESSKASIETINVQSESIVEPVPTTIESVAETLTFQSNDTTSEVVIVETVAESSPINLSVQSNEVLERSESNDSESYYVIIPTFDENEERED